jgi:hypothetical protein
MLWTVHVYMRAVDPAAFTGGAIPAWLSPAANQAGTDVASVAGLGG